MRLAGRVAVVTGSARRLGRAIALDLARRGASLAVHYGGSREAAKRTVEEIRELGVDAEAFQADLQKPDQIDDLFGAIARRFERLDVLVNSAASFRHRPFEEISAAEWDEVQAVNLRAPFLCMRAAAAPMAGSRRDGEPGAIVNIADLAGVQAWPRYAHHGVSKAGLIHLTRIAAVELGPGIRVNAVVPGAILPAPGEDPDGEAWRQRGRAIPVGRVARLEELTGAVAHLVENDFVNGAVLHVDGGEGLVGQLGGES